MRLVSLSPSFTEILENFGLTENLAGVTEECSLDNSAACIGSSKALHLHQILELKPDLVIASQGENRPEEIRALENQTRVVSFGVVSLPSLISAIAEVGELTGREEAAKDLVRSIYSVWRNPSREKVRTLLLLWHTPYLTVNARTYVSQLIEASGGLNVFGAEPVPEIPIEIEDMIDQKPDLILLPSAPYPFSQKQVDLFKALPDFAQKNIELVEGRLFSRFGPRTVTALKTLRAVVEKVESPIL